MVLALDELVIDVASRVKSSERLEGIFGSAFDHEPSKTSAWKQRATSCASVKHISYAVDIPGRLREQEGQADKRDSGEHLQSELHIGQPQPEFQTRKTYRDSPFDLGTGRTLRATISDPSCNESSDTDEQLEGGGKSTSVGRMSCMVSDHSVKVERCLAYRFRTGTLND